MGTVWKLGVVLAGLALTSVCDAADRPEGPLTDEGAIAGAEFRIDIPEGWHGGLIMYAHGYTVAGRTPAYNTTMVAIASDLGYAVAQSRYSRQGWAAREGVLDTEALRRYFADTYGATYPTIVAGHSQGAAIAYATIERFPEVYDGALPMCGSGTSALDFFKRRVFDMRLLFDFFFPGLPGSVVEFPAGDRTMEVVAARSAELIAEHPAQAKAFADMVDLSGPEAIPGTIAFWSEILRELQIRAGGNAFDNRHTVYDGSQDDGLLNEQIPRYAADPMAVEYVREWVTLTGEISDPVLAIHTIVDDLIPPAYANAYQVKTAMHDAAHLYVQSYVTHEGHCNFMAGEMRMALRQLDSWIRDHVQPAPSDLTED